MSRTPQEQAELVAALRADYTAGMTLKALERKYDVAASYIGRLLKKHGVTLRPPGDSMARREAWGGLNRAQSRDYQQRLREWKPGR